MKDLIYHINGAAIEVHKYLGKGHNEKVYGDALELEFLANHIPFVRERKYTIEYKGIQLPSYYYSDFTVYDSIVIELKAIQIANNVVNIAFNY